MMRIDGLSVNYGAVEALKNVSLDVPPGRVTAVIGANGAGKSTLMRTLAGLEKPLAGQVLFNDEDITGGKLRTSFVGASPWFPRAAPPSPI